MIKLRMLYSIASAVRGGGVSGGGLEADVRTQGGLSLKVRVCTRRRRGQFFFQFFCVRVKWTTPLPSSSRLQRKNASVHNAGL
jgi:hypothetical protein